MTLLEALRKYTVIPNEEEAKKCLLGRWIIKYDQSINLHGYVGNRCNGRYWVSILDNTLNMNGECGHFRKPITMLQLARLCDIDYSAWIHPKKENTERLNKAIEHYEKSKKVPNQIYDGYNKGWPVTILKQIHISFDGVTTHCVVKGEDGVIARSKATAVGEDKEHFDQLIGANVALLKLIPKEAWPEFLETLMAIIGIDFQVDFNVNAKLVNADEA